MRNRNGSIIAGIHAIPMSRMSEKRADRAKDDPESTMHTPDRMDMKQLKKHLCDKYNCKKCDVMCAYGRRYMQLKEAQSACGGF